MMKMRAQLGGRPVIVFGLSHANLDRLRADGLNGYIRIEGEELGFEGEIWITAAETARVMVDAFAEGFDAGTKLRIDPRLKS